MNKTRQKQIAEIVGKLDECKSSLEEIITAERDEFDEKSEKWREGEFGQATEETLQHLDDAFNNLESVVDVLSGVSPSKP
jgi:hypothetical protein